MIIASVVVGIALVASFTIPIYETVSPFETWGNNEHFYESMEGMNVTCSTNILGINSNCRATNAEGEEVPWPIAPIT